ncbi:amidohydrolase family protein [Dactylosporangium sp. NPDC051485]|uniref:amidohydrolase family protein n=1 Tax=Dactylosporangium sp. NPDC051485 TaxID=3154846 RepID=UPI00342636FF
MTDMATSARSRSRSARRDTVTLLPDPEPREVWFPFISVDDHVLEPVTTFRDRFPSHLRDAAPRVEYGYNGDPEIPYWLVEDEQLPIGTVNGAVGRPVTEWNGAAQTLDDFRAGVSDSRLRLKEMDLVGAWGSVCFPSVIWGFAGRRLSQIRDREVGLASIKAYNDWMIEEWCAADPDRLIPCQLPWLNDPQVAAQEIRRNAERGFKAVSFSENPLTAGFPSLHDRSWDPFFAACEETGTAINLHVGSSGMVTLPDPKSPVEVLIALFPVNAIVASVDWVYSRIPVRFPNIKIVLSEGGASWVPMSLERLARTHRQLEISEVWKAGEPSPAEVLLRNFWFASLEDPSAFRNLDTIGSQNVLVECDYPHGDSTWPDTQKVLESQLAHLPVEDVFNICVGNAAQVYNASLPPVDWFESSARGKDALGLLR